MAPHGHMVKRKWAGRNNSTSASFLSLRSFKSTEQFAKPGSPVRHLSPMNSVNPTEAPIVTREDKISSSKKANANKLKYSNMPDSSKACVKKFQIEENLSEMKSELVRTKWELQDAKEN